MLSYEKKIFFQLYFQHELSEIVHKVDSRANAGYNFQIAVVDDVMEVMEFIIRYGIWNYHGNEEYQEMKENIRIMTESFKNYLNEIGMKEIEVISKSKDNILPINGKEYMWVETTGRFKLTEDFKRAIAMLDALQNKKGYKL